jgi:hypothetical protein
MYSIYFMKIETHAKLSFYCSDFWPPILPASTTYTKDGAERPHNFSLRPIGAYAPVGHFRHFSAF